MNMPPVVRIFAILGASIALAGCILSQGQLFDTADAITPVAVGAYKEMARNENNAFEEVATVNVAIDGKTYTVSSVDGREPAIVTMHDGGNGLIITMIAEGDEAAYALLRIDNGEVLHWAAACDVAGDLGILADFPGIDDGEGNCMLPDRDTLIAFMTAYASKAEPDYKYVPVAQ